MEHGKTAPNFVRTEPTVYNYEWRDIALHYLHRNQTRWQRLIFLLNHNSEPLGGYNKSLRRLGHSRRRRHCSVSAMPVRSSANSLRASQTALCSGVRLVGSLSRHCQMYVRCQDRYHGASRNTGLFRCTRLRNEPTSGVETVDEICQHQLLMLLRIWRMAVQHFIQFSLYTTISLWWHHRLLASVMFASFIIQSQTNCAN